MAQRLIVEGINDAIVIAEYWQSCGLKDVKGHEGKDEFKEFAKPSNSKDQLKKDLKLILKGDLSDIESIGVVVDADQSPLSTWQSIKRILEASGYTNLASTPAAEGVIISQPPRPKIGVWIMPDNQNPGYLEHFFQTLIKADDSLQLPVNTAIQSLYDQNLVRFPDIRKQKAFVHTWLSWQEMPGEPMGRTLKGKAGFFDLGQPTAQAFLAWSKQVFQFTEE
ncbi:MAG: DUF3226 domain-containing protein [Saprospiraceae bacterium]